MAYQALYRKYRPHSFEDFIDQETVKQILINSIVNNKISHAYLFSGPRGIGKTSMAKIFAKAINCLDFNKNNDVCENCDNCKEANDNSVDIIEIDAASNNGVDQIRDLKNKITVVPSKLKYKVYIIDEVHMLTNSAFNALLKTLEEPPSHVVFILATTEFYEVPETIVSRCQCYSFSRITLNSLIKRLKYIAEQENINITDDAVKEIAYASNGGLRDAIGMLDKINSFTNGEITTDIFKNINGMIGFEEIEKFYSDIFDENLNEILLMINKVNEQGYDFKNFIEREMLYVRDKIIDFYVKNKELKGTVDKNIDLVSTLNDILNRLKDAINPLVIVQIYILKYIEKNSAKSSGFSAKTEANIISQKIPKVENDKKIISQEIKSDVNVQNVISQEIKNPQINVENKPVAKANNGIKTNRIKVNEENKQIRINNSMATANMAYKKELQAIWNNLENHFMDTKFGKIAQLLSDTEPMVVGSEYAILTALTDGLINNIYSDLSLTEDFIATIYRKMAIVIVKNDEFEQIKNKYIADKKNNITYEIREECGKLVEEGNNLISQAIDLFGADLVERE